MPHATHLLPHASRHMPHASHHMPHASRLNRCLRLIAKLVCRRDNGTSRICISVQLLQSTATGPRDRDRIFAQAQAEVSSPPVPCVSDETHTESSSARQSSSGMSRTTLFAHESAEYSPCETENLSAATGNGSAVAQMSRTTAGTFVQDAGSRLTELRRVLERRKCEALTPYNPDAWEMALRAAGLSDRYPHIPEGLRRGFVLDIPSIKSTQAPPNKESVATYQQNFLSIVHTELEKESYIGPLKFNEVESLIGHFQSSPFCIIPKPGRPGRYRIIQNYSFPHTPSQKFPDTSINSYMGTTLIIQRPSCPMHVNRTSMYYVTLHTRHTSTRGLTWLCSVHSNAAGQKSGMSSSILQDKKSPKRTLFRCIKKLTSEL